MIVGRIGDRIWYLLWFPFMVESILALVGEAVSGLQVPVPRTHEVGEGAVRRRLLRNSSTILTRQS